MRGLHMGNVAGNPPSYGHVCGEMPLSGPTWAVWRDNNTPIRAASGQMCGEGTERMEEGEGRREHGAMTRKQGAWKRREEE